MTEAAAQLHGVLGLVALVVTGGLAIGAGAAVLVDRGRAAVDLLRRIGLGLVVAQAALGLALTLRGGQPAEGIHWLYGGAIVLVLLAPSSLEPASLAARRGLLVGSALLATVFAWRLWGSG
jgi:hypothetical protein